MSLLGRGWIIYAAVAMFAATAHPALGQARRRLDNPQPDSSRSQPTSPDADPAGPVTPRDSQPEEESPEAEPTSPTGDLGDTTPPSRPEGDTDPFARPDAGLSPPGGMGLGRFLASTPNMFGESLSNRGTIVLANPGAVNVVNLCAPGVAPGQIVEGEFVSFSNPLIAGRVFRVSDNQNPLPQRRIYLNYHYFNDAIEVVSFDNGAIVAGRDDMDVHLYTFGVERTLWNDLASIQLQVPLATSLASDITNFTTNQNAAPAPTDTEIGNVSLALKALLYADRMTAVGSGVGLTLPTAPDLTFQTVTPAGVTEQALRIENETVVLSPFVGASWTGHPRMFSQAFVQVHLPIHDDELSYRANPNGPLFVGDAETNAVVQSSVSFGYWIFRDPFRYVSEAAALFELHGSSSFGHDFIFLGGDGAGRANGLIDGGRFSYLNATVGAEFRLAKTTIRPAFVFPLTGVEHGALNQNDRPFDFEFSLQVNRFF